MRVGAGCALYEEQDGKIDRKRMSKIETRHTLVAPVQTEQTSEARGEEKPSKTGRKVSCPTPCRVGMSAAGGQSTVGADTRDVGGLR
jgi:hypothetical protein